MSLFSRLWLRWFDRHDPAIYSTGVRVIFSGYDYEKAVKGSRAAKSRTETGRKLSGQSKTRQKSVVVPIRRKQA